MLSTKATDVRPVQELSQSRVAGCVRLPDKEEPALVGVMNLVSQFEALCNKRKLVSLRRICSCIFSIRERSPSLIRECFHYYRSDIVE